MKPPDHILVYDGTSPDKVRRLDHSMLGPAPERSPGALRLPRIGIWDLGAWLGGLGDLIDGLNGAQHDLVFFQVMATVPAGLVSKPERMNSWLKEALGRSLRKKEREEIKDNLVFEDFYQLGEQVRRDLKLDYLVGVTPSKVAFEDDDDTVKWNYFSTCEKRVLLASTFDLRRFSKETKIPFDAYLGVIVIAQVFVAMFGPELGFHENSGCLFDFNADRESFKDTLRELKIDDACRDAIPESHRAAVQDLLTYLRTL